MISSSTSAGACRLPARLCCWRPTAGLEPSSSELSSAWATKPPVRESPLGRFGACGALTGRPLAGELEREEGALAAGEEPLEGAFGLEMRKLVAMLPSKGGGRGAASESGVGELMGEGWGLLARAEAGLVAG
jgi:hypothetical protein